MSYFEFPKPPDRYDKAYFNRLLRAMSQAVNYLDVENLPSGLDGLVIQSNTVSIESLAEGQFSLVFLAGATLSTTGTVETTRRNYVASRWATAASLELEVYGTSAKVELYGSTYGKLGELTLSGTQGKTAVVDKPSTSQTLYAKVISTSGSSVNATCICVNIIP